MHERLAYVVFFSVVCGALGLATLAMLFVAVALLWRNARRRQ